jgi:DNA polymerase
MTADEKQRAAGFLDLAGDFLMYGFRSTTKEYHFEDDAQSGAQSPVGEKKAPYPAGEEDTIARIAAEIRACNNCPLAATRTNAAPGEGVTRPLVLVIGEGPGAEEDAQGRPFVGRAGQLLDKMLSSIDLSRNSNCFIANVVKCRPPGNRDPQPEETQACAHFLKRQILLLNPEFILVAGRVAAQTLLDTTEPVAKLRGKFTSLTVGEKKIPLLVTYHPAFLLRSEEFKRPAWEDLKLLRSRIENSKKENSSGVN